MQLGYSITGISNSFWVLLVVSQVYCNADTPVVRVLCSYIRRGAPATILCHFIVERTSYSCRINTVRLALNHNVISVNSLNFFIQ